MLLAFIARGGPLRIDSTPVGISASGENGPMSGIPASHGSALASRFNASPLSGSTGVSVAGKNMRFES